MLRLVSTELGRFFFQPVVLNFETADFLEELLVGYFPLVLSFSSSERLGKVRPSVPSDEPSF